jgi:hypothetical protein
MIKFIGYVVKYKANTMKLARLEEELDYYKTALQLEEKKSNDKNNALRQINTLLSEYEKGGPIRTPLYKEIKTIVDNNTEKKLSDEILPHFTSNS